MNWDIIFFVKGWPEDRRFQGPWITTFKCPLDEEKEFIHAECLPMQAKRFFMGVKPGALAITCVRVDNTDSYREAVLLAKDTLRLALDGLAIVPSATMPKIGPLIGYRERGSRDVQYTETIAEGLVNITPRDQTNRETQWHKRTRLILNELSKFLNLSFKANEPTPVQEQLIFSAKMYRLGNESEDFGVQFLTKFCALEGLLAAGQVTPRKEKFCRRRIRFLMGWNPQSEEALKLKKLYRVRNDIAHESKTTDAAIYIDEIDFIYSAVFVQILRRQENADTLEQAWEKIDLPDEILTRRPQEFGRFALTSGLFETKMISKNFRQQIDEIFERVNEGLKSKIERGSKE